MTLVTRAALLQEGGSLNVGLPACACVRVAALHRRLTAVDLASPFLGQGLGRPSPQRI
jgi:hypothetical protein